VLVSAVGGYRVEAGGNGVWFLVDEAGRIRGTFFPIGGGRWRGRPPHVLVAVEHDIGDVPDPHLVMAGLLAGAERDGVSGS
jgi:hypothetical protein